MGVKVGVKWTLVLLSFYFFFTFLPFYLSKLLSSTKCLSSPFTSFYNFPFYFFFFVFVWFGVQNYHSLNINQILYDFFAQISKCLKKVITIQHICISRFFRKKFE